MASPVKNLGQRSSLQTKEDEYIENVLEPRRELTTQKTNKRKQEDTACASPSKTRSSSRIANYKRNINDAVQINSDTRQEKASSSVQEVFQANGLVTLVRTNLQEKLPTLILKLKPTDQKWFQSRRWIGSRRLSVQDLDRYIDEQFDEYIKTNTQNLNDIRHRIKQTRPQKGTDNYEIKMKQYIELVEWTTKLMESLTKMFDQMLTTYRLRVEKLWDEINEFRLFSSIDMNVLEDNFQNDVEKIFQQAMMEHVEPILRVMEDKIHVHQPKLVKKGATVEALSDVD